MGRFMNHKKLVVALALIKQERMNLFFWILQLHPIEETQL